VKTIIKAVGFVLTAALLASCASQDSRARAPAAGNTTAPKRAGQENAGQTMGSNAAEQDGADDTAGRGLEVEALSVADTDIAVFPQLGHSGSVESLAISPDGKYIISLGRGADGNVILWEAESGRELRRFLFETMIYSLDLSPDGKQIAVGTWEGITLLDGESLREIRSFVVETRAVVVRSVAFSPDGRYLAAGYGYGYQRVHGYNDGDSSVRVWRVSSGELVSTFTGHSDAVTSVAFSPDGKWIISGSEDTTVKLWDAANGRLLRTLAGHSDAVTSVAFSPDGKWIVSGSEDTTVKIWDAGGGGLFRTFTGHSKKVNSVAFSPNGKQVVSTSSGVGRRGEERGIIWDAETGQEIYAFGSNLYSAIFSSGGKQVVCGGIDELTIRGVESGTEIRKFGGYSDGISSVAFSPDGKRLLCGTDNHKMPAILWDTEDGRLERDFRSNKGSGTEGVAFSPDGKQFVVGINWYTQVWDTESGKLIHDVRGPRSIFSVAFSPDGKQIVSGFHNGTITLLDAASGREIRNFPGHSGVVYFVGFSPDGKQILSSSHDKTIKLWDAASGRELRSFQDTNSVQAAVFSPEGKQIAFCCLNTVKLWDIGSGNIIRLFKPKQYSHIQSVTFSPDGTRIAAGDMNGQITLWNAASGEEIRTFTGHTGWVESVAFSPDGKRLASGSKDYTARIWDVSSGAELARLISFGGSDTQIASATRGLTVETESAATAIDDEWLAMTPEGYYQASPQGDRYINVRVGNTVTGIDAYRSVLYNPDVVQARLRGLPDPASK
jgi:WD40 repeat protein